MMKSIFSFVMVLGFASSGRCAAESSLTWNEYLSRIEQVGADMSDLVSPVAVQKTLEFLKSHQSSLDGKIKNRRYVIINDFTQNSTELRMAVLDLQKGSVWKLMVSHGVGSGPGARVYHCSSLSGRKETPPGFLLVTYENPRSVYGSSLIMDGLEARNANSRARGIVFHPNKTNAQRDQLMHQFGYLNLSEGCAQLTREDYADFKPLVQGGSLLYNFCPEDAGR